MIYQVYMLSCADGSLYTGISNDLARRLRAHNRGIASKYTRSRLPVQLLYQESWPNKSEALRRELEIKKLTREQKWLLIQNSAEASASQEA